MSSNHKILYLYNTQACHLCEIAEEVLQPLLVDYNLQLEKVDIIGSDDLVDKYGIRIPVIRMAGQDEELGWPFDQSAAIEYLRNALKGS